LVRIPCPRCGASILRLSPVDPDEEVTCPACGARFVPEEEAWVDPEDG